MVSIEKVYSLRTMAFGGYIKWESKELGVGKDVMRMRERCK